MVAERLSERGSYIPHGCFMESRVRPGAVEQSESRVRADDIIELVIVDVEWLCKQRLFGGPWRDELLCFGCCD